MPGRSDTSEGTARDALSELRPALHRYLSRMMGSVFDGEDVLQEVLLKAHLALDSGAEVIHPKAWLFRIANTTALNALRARARHQALKDAMTHVTDFEGSLPTEGGTADALIPFMSLTPKQRSAAILFDVLGYTAEEVADMTEATVDSVKSNLKRARSVLRSTDVEARPAEDVLSPEIRGQLRRYAALFNAHDFDAIRQMLAEEVALDVVGREKRQGKARVGLYFTNYAKAQDWHMVPGLVGCEPAMLVFDRADPGMAPAYVVRLILDGSALTRIQDFRYARYVMQDCHWRRIIIGKG